MKTIKKLWRLLLLCQLSLFGMAHAQMDPGLYAKADSVREFSDLAYHTNVRTHWIGHSDNFWYSVNTKKGTEYFLVNAADRTKAQAFEAERLADSLGLLVEKDIAPYDIPWQDLQFSSELNKITFELENAKWSCMLDTYKITKLEELREDNEPRRYWGEGRDELGNEPEMSPDSVWTAFVEGYNVFVRSTDGEDKIQLSYDGNESDYYSSYLEWSPDSKKLATFKVRDVDRRIIRFVEAAPEDRLQPVVHERSYLKPGDALPVRIPALFDVGSNQQFKIKIPASIFNQYSANRLNWKTNSESFTFEINERGHQLYQVAEVSATDGNMRILIEETSETFIDYSGKRFRHDIDETNEIIWASERDGWNHLYLYDAESGHVKNQITAGMWVIRDVVHVDEENRNIIFGASGKNAGEDPYFIHFYRINFDGSGLTPLTRESAHHDVTFSTNFAFFVDTYSKVDLPPVSVLRDAKNGEIILNLEKADISELLQKGWQAPEVFVAKGRDGVTDIWGNIYRPTHYDPNKTYPVLEYIYAGPHSSFAQKSFRPYSRSISSLAELGFVIVQMDGMGTSNRSKAFHDVCWQNLKDAGFPDRKLWIKAAAEKYPNLDISNLGIYGTSAGGQSAMAALLWHSDMYKVGVSSCGCHDNRMDKIWWNEQWMGYPIGKHYEENSNVVNAHLLEGQLMLLVGEVDDNVDPASTIQVADALIDANKDFELVVLPGMNHTSGGNYGERKRRDFFVKHILRLNPPNWNKVKKEAQ